MQANGVQPSIVTYTALLGGYNAKNDVVGAWRVYKTIVEVCLGGCCVRFSASLALCVSVRVPIRVDRQL